MAEQVRASEAMRERETGPPAWRRWAALAVLVGSVLLLAIDGTVLYLAVPSLTQALDPTAAQILWIGDIYSLVLAGLLVTMGNLADRIGRKKLLLTGVTAFGLVSVLAAYAGSAEVLIVARLLLGVAGATIMPSTLSLIRNIFLDQAERTRAIAIWASASAAGIALGPLVGGLLLERFWWGSVFLINVPVMIAVLAFGLWLLPESRDDNPGPFDIASSLLSMAAVMPFVYAIKKLAERDVTVAVVVAAVVSAVAGVAFVYRQRRLRIPMIDVDLFRNSAFSGAVLANFISVFALTGALFFFSQYLQLVRGLTPLRAGLAELPAAGAAVVAAAVVGVVLSWLGRGRAIALGLLVGAVGLALVGLLEDSENLVWVILALIPLGLGVGVAETLSVDAVVSAVKPSKAGAAASVSETAYELGVAFGIAVLGSIVTALYRAGLELPPGLPGEIATHIRDSLAAAVHVIPSDDPLILVVEEAFVDAMQVATYIGAGIMVCGSLVALRLIPNERSAPPQH